ncbi:MAG: translation initiation factor IF-2, partial [Bacteroidaceae bacterium]|nr:translation initiation factor IF-2 [Bacteroidaceae bacterium]
MKIRLNKVQKELNIGLSTIVEFLQKKGIEIKEDPNAVVPERGYELLMEAFSADKNARLQSDKFTQARQNKERPKNVVPEPEKVVKEEKTAATVTEPAKHSAPAKAEEPVKEDKSAANEQPKTEE